MTSSVPFGRLVLSSGASLPWFFAVAAAAMFLYGAITFGAVASGVWFDRNP